MERQIELQERPAQIVLGKHYRTSITKIAEDIGAGYGAIFAYLGELGEPPAGMPFVLYPGDMQEFNLEDFEMEVCVPVSRMLESRGDIKAVEIPGGLAAVTLHKGPYDGVEPAYNDLETWVKENGYKYAGPARETYMNDPGQVPESELLTEISIPVAKA